MPNPTVVALDVGTSSVRAMLFDHLARAIPSAEIHLPYQPKVGRDGMAEVDPRNLEALVASALDRLLQTARANDLDCVAAVGVSTFWHGLLAADASGRALTPLYLWSDTRAGPAAEELKRQVDVRAVHQRTGCTIHSSYWPAKLAWLRKRRPALWKHPGARFIAFGDLLYQHLFGRLGTSLSMASGTGLQRLDGRGWDPALLQLLGLDEARFAPIAVSDEGLLPQFARRWPRLARVPWLHGVGDGALANLGSGCVDLSRRALTVGTSGALRVLHERPPTRLPKGLWCYRLDRDRYVVGGSFSNGGNLHAWLVSTLAVDERRLEAQVSRMKPCRHGLTVLPHLAGERSLGFSERATGAFEGLTQATTAVDIVRAALESVAIEFGRVDGRLDQVLPGALRLVASGAGLLASPAWMQMMADTCGKPVVASPAREASSRGAAILALERLGRADAGWEELPRRSAPGRTFEPEPSARAAYRRATANQERLYRDLIDRRGPASGGAGAHLRTGGGLG